MRLNAFVALLRIMSDTDITKFKRKALRAQDYYLAAILRDEEFERRQPKK